MVLGWQRPGRVGRRRIQFFLDSPLGCPFFIWQRHSQECLIFAIFAWKLSIFAQTYDTRRLIVYNRSGNHKRGGENLENEFTAEVPGVGACICTDV